MICYLPALPFLRYAPRIAPALARAQESARGAISARESAALLYLWLLRESLQEGDAPHELALLLPGSLLGGGVRVERWLDLRLSESRDDEWQLASRWREEPGRVLAVSSFSLLLEAGCALATHPMAHPLVAGLLPRSGLRDFAAAINSTESKGRQARLAGVCPLLATGCFAGSGERSAEGTRDHSHFELLLRDANELARARALDAWLSGVGAADAPPAGVERALAGL